MHKVIVLDDLSQEGLDLLAAAPGIEYEVRTGLKGDDLRQALQEFDGAICRSGVKITAESLAGSRRLKAVVRAGVGNDNIDKTAATRAGVVVIFTPLRQIAPSNSCSAWRRSSPLRPVRTSYSMPGAAANKSRPSWDKSSRTITLCICGKGQG